jgi:hypothetical protein
MEDVAIVAAFEIFVLTGDVICKSIAIEWIRSFSCWHFFIINYFKGTK